MSERPLILLDVDGVLNPMVRPGLAWERHRVTGASGGFTLWLNPAHGPMLLALAAETGAELVWATTWEHLANEWIGPVLGLPDLPVIEVTRGFADARDVCDKSVAVAEYVQRRPFVWFDDDLGTADRLWLDDHPGVGAFWLVHVNERFGLTPEHLAQAAEWLVALTSESTTGGGS